MVTVNKNLVTSTTPGQEITSNTFLTKHNGAQNIFHVLCPIINFSVHIKCYAIIWLYSQKELKMTQPTIASKQKRFTKQMIILGLIALAFIVLFTISTKNFSLTNIIITSAITVVIVTSFVLVISAGRAHIKDPLNKAAYQGYSAGYHNLISQADSYQNSEVRAAYAEAYANGKTAKELENQPV